jgi:transcriptional regulator with XRE-family HTH domain
MTSMINDDMLPTLKQVRAARALLAMTQADLARAANVAVSTVADFERGQRTPVVNNAQAIKKALEAKGIQFLGGGVVTSLHLPAPTLPKPGKSLRWIEARDLSQWGETLDGRAKLPELISRLIFAAYGPAARLRFPSGESIQFAGWDGTCEVEIGTTYIPAAKSVWEMSGQRSQIGKKAEGDYTKRTTNPLGIIPEDTTFVFCTPQRWPKKDLWIAKKRAERVWKDVQVVDGDMLVHWLEQFPGVADWLAEKIGRRPPGLRNLNEIWDEWSLATLPALTFDLLVANRDDQATAVLAWLYGPPSVLALQAEAVDEAMAFLRAAIEPLPETQRLFWESRFLAPQSDQVARDLIGLGPKLVVVLNQGDPGLARKLADQGHHVYVAFGSEVGLPKNVLRLLRPWRHQIQSGLEDMGLETQKAQALAGACGRSLPVLRRLMTASPAKRPIWSEPPISLSLLAAMLAGAWREDHPVDKAILERLSGLSYDALEAALVPLAATIDGPIRRSGPVWKLASLRDAWHLLAASLTGHHLDLLESCFLEVLGNPDPAFDAGPDEQWKFDRSPPKRASDELRRGLSETMIALGVYPDRASSIFDARDRSARAVRTLLADSDEHRWWSLSGDFRLLVEAAPEAFLDGIDAALRSQPSPLRSLFRSDAGFLHPREYLSNLLWALETLCWSPLLLSRVALLLARLADMDPGGKISNRPSNTLRRIFLPWYPQTFATAAERLTVIDRILIQFPRVGWELLLALAPSSHQVSNRSAMPLWRDYSDDPPEPVTRPSLTKVYGAIGNRLIAAAGKDPGRWASLLDHWANFGPLWCKEAADALGPASAKFADAERTAFRERLRALIIKHESFAEADWAMREEALVPLRAIFDALEPADVRARLAWLFGRPNYIHRTDLSWQEAAEQKLVDQRAAAAAILAETAADDIIEFARSVELPDDFGHALATCSASDGQKNHLLELALPSEDAKIQRFADGMLLGLSQERGETWVLRRFEDAIRAQSGESVALRLAFRLGSRRENWDRISAAGPALDHAYWRRLGVRAIRPSEDPRFVCSKLLAVGRGRVALAWIASHDDMPVATDVILEVLRDSSIIDPQIKDPDPNEATMVSYYLGCVFNRLDQDELVSESEIVALEWRYYQALKHSERPARNLHKALAREPVFFVTLLKALYGPGEGSETEEQPIDSEAAQAVASQAYDVLSDWRYVPGSDDTGVIDSVALQVWVKEVRRLAGEVNRGDIAEQKIGEILSAARFAKGEPWPPEPVRELIESDRSPHLEEGFEIGLYNRRGVTMRMPTDGGEQERDLATKYRTDAKELAIKWPQTSAVLRRIAESYERDAEREDQNAEQGDW